MSGNGSNGGKMGFGMDKGKGKEENLSMDKGVQGVLGKLGVGMGDEGAVEVLRGMSAEEQLSLIQFVRKQQQQEARAEKEKRRDLEEMGVEFEEEEQDELERTIRGQTVDEDLLQAE
ncbi:hypothetical protein CROQUDRAFT_136596 [Cronartium quercuum f. sp. fusiforme G11]|uniref:Uncharacterized protein n=1 Tax=Cronartium quercuum f. sp. fusiforme G11 TaxID=708437 RepID=A0A9P6T7M9_9BASI|nr:hypothetical protein CROQUDRAFT_136596 [Cronartium quercuum f. sp. fusiforme G11]